MDSIQLEMNRMLGKEGGLPACGSGTKKTSLKCSYWAQGLEDHVPHPTNGSNMSLTTRFRYVLTMALDGVLLLKFGKGGAHT